MTDDDIARALREAAPIPDVPTSLLAGAHRRRAARRRGVLTAGGALAVVAAAALVLPSLPNLIGDAAVSTAGSGAAPAAPAPAPGAEADADADGGSAQEVGGAGAVLDLPFESTPGVSEAAAASEALAWRLIGNLDGPNRVTSPSSLAMNLAMLGEGAVGPSAESIDEALGLAGDERSKAFGALRQSLLGYESLPAEVDANNPPETPIVHQAGRVVAIDWPVEQPFLDRARTFYDASATQVPRESAQADLDEWVRRNTAGLIEKSGIEVTPETKAVLQDAVLFAASWRQEFTGRSTGPFLTPEGEEKVAYVSGSQNAQWADGERWRAVRLAYDDALAADVILPDVGVAPEQLTAEELAEAGRALGAAEPKDDEVTMPSFDLAAKTNLLRSLPEVDLSHLDGIFPEGEVEQWVQQVRLQVNAKGTVGAAVTEAAVRTSAGGPPPFVVDRPYVFRVVDTRTGWPLFLAVIADPTAVE